MTRTRLHAWVVFAFLAAEWSRYVCGWRAASIVLVGAASVAAVVCLVRHRHGRSFAVILVSLVSGLAAGTAWALWQPAHPSVAPGERDTILGEVQSVKVAHGRTEVMVAVRREGRDAHQCHYQALVFAERGDRAEVGQWVEAEGIFVVSDRPQTAMDVMSPLYLFDGRVRTLDVPPDLGERVTSWMASSMQDVSPAGHREAVDLALSMVFGATQGSLPQTVSSDFLAAGVTHLLVASGSNVGFALDMAAVPWQRLFGRAFSGRRRVAYGMYALCVIWGFALLCGFQLAVLRAACGASYLVLASMCGRRVQSYTVLWSSAFVAGVVDPGDLLTPTLPGPRIRPLRQLAGRPCRWTAGRGSGPRGTSRGRLRVPGSTEPEPEPDQRRPQVATRPAGWGCPGSGTGAGPGGPATGRPMTPGRPMRR